MDKQKNIDNARAVFGKNNDIKELYFSNDGQAFYKPGPAVVHQREIGGKKEQIHKVKNGSYVETVESVTEDTVEMNAPEATKAAGGENGDKKGKKK